MDGLSIRAYARSRRARELPGGTHTAVRKAIDTGRLVHSVRKEGRRFLIDQGLADQEWEDQTDPVAQTTDPVAAPARDPALFPDAFPAPLPPPPAQESAGPSIKKSQAIRLAYQARLAQLEFEKKSGQVERTADVRMDASHCAASTKAAMLNIPPRVRDIIAAETDADVIDLLLRTEINAALAELVRTRGQ